MNLYGISVKNTIEQKALLVGSAKATCEYCYSKGLKLINRTKVYGYMNQNLSTLHKYDGRYGVGVVRTLPCYYGNCKPSTRYMTIEYWVKEN